jgi:hypothetical protein
MVVVFGNGWKAGSSIGCSGAGVGVAASLAEPRALVAW